MCLSIGSNSKRIIEIGRSLHPSPWPAPEETSLQFMAGTSRPLEQILYQIVESGYQPQTLLILSRLLIGTGKMT
jgi:hypothetical protein